MGQLISDHSFRIRAVNVLGPGPASEPAKDITLVDVVWVSRASLEWDATTGKATLAWSQAEHTDLRWWSIVVLNRGASNIPIVTTRYEIPGTFSAGQTVRVYLAGCSTIGCASRYRTSGRQLSFTVGAPELVTGFSATPGDAQITLSWDAPTGGSITHFEYAISGLDISVSASDIPDGNDAGTDPADETSYTITGLTNARSHRVRIRAANANGHGPWTETIQNVVPLASGVPARPSGMVWLVDSFGRDESSGVTLWDDPQDPSITVYQAWDGSAWNDVPGTDATTTSVSGKLFLIRAVNAEGVGQPARDKNVLTPPPARPAGLKAAPANRRVTLTWDDPGRDVYIESWSYTTDGGTTWVKIPGSQTTGQGQFTRYTVPGLTNGVAYTFVIVAENARGTSPLSAVVSATPLGGAPAKPTGLSAVPGNAEATLAWDDPHDASITKYQVRQGNAAWADVSGSDAGTISHTVGTLTNGTSYTFQIRAVNDHNGDGTDDPGPASDSVTVTPGVPAAPASLVAAPGDTQVTLTWTVPASNGGSAVTGYEYTQSADAATPTWTDVPDSGSDGRADEREYTVTGLTNNTVYAFAVRAENANGQGASTPTRRTVPVDPGAPQQPAGLQASPGHQEVRLTWVLPGFHHPVTAYQYRQSTNGGTTWSPNWTAITGSDADTVAHKLTGLTNGTTYTFELRGLNGSTAGPSGRAQATPSQATGTRKIIDHDDDGRLTASNGDTYTVTPLSPPEDLDWEIAVPVAMDIDGRTFTIRSLQGTTPYTAPRYAFTSSGQEGLDIVVSPDLSGRAQVCLKPSDKLLLEADGISNLVVLRHDGKSWTALPTTYENGMVCGTTSGFSAFVVGYVDTDYNEAPAAQGSIPAQSVVDGRTVTLNVAPYFTDANNDSLTYAAASSDTTKVSVSVSGSELSLTGAATGSATVTVTATDPDGETATQDITVTVGANSSPTVVSIPAQTLVLSVVDTVLVPLNAYFSDPDNDPLTYTATSGDTDVVTATVDGSTGVLTLAAVAASDNPVTITVEASDPDNARVSQTIAVTVRADLEQGNVGPVVTQAVAPQELRAGGPVVTLELADYFTDPDGDNLAYGASSSDSGVVTAAVSESQLTLTAEGGGSAVVTVTARDPDGLQALLPVVVTVTPAPSRPISIGTGTATTVGNAAPQSAQAVPPQVLLAGTTSAPLDLTPYFRDPDGDALTYVAVSDNVAVAITGLARGSSQLVIHGVSAGQAVITVTALDPQGGSVSQRLAVTVAGQTGTVPEAAPASDPPEMARRILPQIVAAGETSAPLDLVPYFRDPDGDALTYAAVSYDKGVLVAEVAEGGNELVLRGIAPGEASIIVTATDPHGGSASQPVAVRVRTGTVLEASRLIPPQIVEVGAASEPLDLSSYFHDPDGDALTYVAASDDTDVVVAEVAAGSSQLVLRGVAVGEAEVILMVGDLFGERARQTMTVTVRTNAAPEVEEVIPAQTVEAGSMSEPLDLAAYFGDPDGDALIFAVESDDSEVLVAEVSAGGSELVLRGVAAGEARITVEASDMFGRWARQTVEVTVRTNAPPEVAQVIPSQSVPVGNTSDPLDLASYFRDPDGDPLTYDSVSANVEVATATVAAHRFIVAGVEEGRAPSGVSGDRLSLTGLAAGTSVVTVTASDLYGGRASQTLLVTVERNAPPEVLQAIPAQSVPVGESSEPLDLAAYFRDPDGDPLTYVAVSDNPEVMEAGVAGSLFTVTGVGVGTAAATVIARDPHDASARQSVTVTVRIAEQAWLRAWTARFGRTVSGQVLDGVQERLRTSRQVGFEATLAGHQLGGLTEDEEAMGRSGRDAWLQRELGTLAGWMDEQTGHAESGGARQTLTGRDLLTSTVFTLTGGGPEDGFGALWGRGVVSHFAGEDGELSLDGEVATGMLGADWVSGRWLTGLTLALSRGTGGYRSGESSGEIESTLTGLYPWVGYHLTNRLSVWTAAGYGTGVLTLTPPDHASLTTDVSLTLVAAGARSELLDLPQLDGVMLALETDTRLTRTSTGETAGLDATDASVWQVRLGLEGSRPIALEDGGELRPVVELGLRHDGGDAETGGGVEVGAGLGFSKPASGLSLDLAVRGLLTHEVSGLEEWGASASLMYDPAPSSEEGLSMSLQQSVGASSSGGVHALLGRDTMGNAATETGIAPASRLQAQMGYGLPLGGGRFIGTPKLGFGLSEGRRDYTLGWHLGVARKEELALTLGVEAKRLENADGSNPEHGVMLQLRLGH